MFVEDKIKKLLDYNNSSEDTSFDKEYQSTFSEEGIRKSKYILDFLDSNDEVSGEDLSKYLFVSIGGADGSEAESILKETNIDKAILLEISDDAAESARERRDKLAKIDKTLAVFQGDATQRLGDVITRMKEFRDEENINGLILSIQAVIHELPRRSPGFRASTFFGQLFSVFDKNMFFGRETIEAERWPDIVAIKVGDATSESLSKLAVLVNDKLKITDFNVTPVAKGFVDMNKTLALETLHKLIRSKSVSEFRYELGEQLTSVNPDSMKNIIESHLERSTVHLETTTTEGFKKDWKGHSVEVKDEIGNPLSYPTTHARFIAVSIPSKKKH